MPAERAGCDSANLQDGRGASAWCMRCDTVKWQGGEIVISGIRWVFMLSFLCQVWGSGANGCLGYLATSEPLKKPRL